MNANPKFLAATAEVDSAAVAPLPKSRKVYETGSRPDIRVPFREIEQADTPTMFGGEKNPPLTVYDCSGPYTDPDAKIDIRRGLPELRRAWIEERGDTELLAGPTSDYGKERLTDPKLTAMRFDLRRPPRRAKSGANVTQMHYARRGIITPEMEFVAIRENLRREQYLKRCAPAVRMARRWSNACCASIRASPSAPPFPRPSRPSSCATRSRAAAPSSRPTSTTRKSSRWPSAATSW